MHHVMLESTGSYWKPIFNILEGHVQVALANPQEVKARKGHKTDQKDAWWLAHLLRHGMVTPSFIPPRPQRELRDLTRRRRKLIQTASAEKSRISKVLEDANIKLGNVLSVAALEEHQMREHHRQMIRFSVEHMRFIEEQLAELDQLIRAKIEEAGYTQQWELLRTLPAVRENAAVVLAEMGPDPAQFPDEKHLGSWSGLCPGNNRSAGRNKRAATPIQVTVGSVRPLRRVPGLSR